MGPTGTDLAAGALSAATVGAAGVGAAIGVPEGDGIPCVFRAVSGLPCPFCGLTHSVMAIGDGDLAASLSFHPLGIVALALAVVVLVALGAAAARRRAIAWPARAPLVGTAAVVAAVWTFTLIGGGST